MSDKFATDNTPDPFENQKAPSLSFKKVQEGHEFDTTVVSLPVVLQQRDFESGEMLTWPDGNKKEVVTFRVEVDGEVFSVWAKKPSSLFTSLVEAQKEAGGRMAIGDNLKIKWTHSEPNKKNAKLNDAKIMKSKLTKVDALAE